MSRFCNILILLIVVFGLEEVIITALSKEHVEPTVTILPSEDVFKSAPSFSKPCAFPGKYIQKPKTSATELPLRRSATSRLQEVTTANETPRVHGADESVETGARLPSDVESISSIRGALQAQFGSASVGAVPLETDCSENQRRVASSSARKEHLKSDIREDAFSGDESNDTRSEEDADPRLLIQIEEAPVVTTVAALSRQTIPRKVNLLRLPLLLGLTLLGVSLGAEIISRTKLFPAGEDATTNGNQTGRVSIREARVQADSPRQGRRLRHDSYSEEDDDFYDHNVVKDSACNNCEKNRNDRDSKWDYPRFKEVFLLPALENAVDRFRGNNKPLNITSRDVASGLIDAGSTVVSMIRNAREEASATTETDGPELSPISNTS